MTGCAGGLSGGLWAQHGARLHHGASYVLDALGFDERMRAAAFVVTGEGRIDEQTLQGKIVGEVATRCRQAGVPCHAVVGRIELEPFAAAHPRPRLADGGHDAGRAAADGRPARGVMRAGGGRLAGRARRSTTTR